MLAALAAVLLARLPLESREGDRKGLDKSDVFGWSARHPNPTCDRSCPCASSWPPSLQAAPSTCPLWFEYDTSMGSPACGAGLGHCLGAFFIPMVEGLARLNLTARVRFASIGHKQNELAARKFFFGDALFSPLSHGCSKRIVLLNSSSQLHLQAPMLRAEACASFPSTCTVLRLVGKYENWRGPRAAGVPCWCRWKSLLTHAQGRLLPSRNHTGDPGLVRLGVATNCRVQT